MVIIWRFTGTRVFSHVAEQRAQKLVAIQFFILAPYVGFESLDALIGGEHADVSWVGFALAAGSVVFMPMLGIAKQRLADTMGSAATAGEGRQNMLCAYLAGALLIGLLGNALVGAWWLDPVAGRARSRSRPGPTRSSSRRSSAPTSTSSARARGPAALGRRASLVVIRRDRRAIYRRRSVGGTIGGQS